MPQDRTRGEFRKYLPSSFDRKKYVIVEVTNIIILKKNCCDLVLVFFLGSLVQTYRFFGFFPI
jgi:hypothetical protein